MLSRETCEKVWHCHREIEAANKLLEEVIGVIKINKEKSHLEMPKGLKDTWGRQTELELGVPSGENSKRLFRVSFDLAEPVIKAHIAKKEAELKELNEIAKMEFGV